MPQDSEAAQFLTQVEIKKYPSALFLHDGVVWVFLTTPGSKRLTMVCVVLIG
jgi:hypothetical protein